VNKKRQLVLTIFLSRILFFGLGISYIINLAKNISIICMFIGFLLGYLLLNYLLEKDIYSFLKIKLGKVFLAFICLFLLNNIMVAFSTLTSNFYLITTPTILIVISICLVFLYGSTKGLGTILRFSDFLIMISVLIYIFIVIFLTKNINITNFLPIKIDNIANGLLSIIATSILSNIPIILLLSLTKSIDKPSIKKGYLIGSLSILLMLIGIIGIFGFDFSNTIRYPEYILLKKISVLNTFENIETFLSIIWFNDLIITGIICTMILKNILSKKTFYIIYFLEIFFCYKVFINNYQNTLFLFQNTFYILSIPFLIVILYKKKKHVT